MYVKSIYSFLKIFIFAKLFILFTYNKIRIKWIKSYQDFHPSLCLFFLICHPCWTTYDVKMKKKKKKFGTHKMSPYADDVLLKVEGPQNSQET